MDGKSDLPYPANLLFAQNMALMAMTQTQQWEGYAAQLSAHLAGRSKPLFTQVAVVHTEQDVYRLLQSLKDTIATGTGIRGVAGAALGVDGGGDAGAGGAAARPDGGEAGGTREAEGRGPAHPAQPNAWVRYRLGPILKMALLLILVFDATLGFLLFYFFFAFLFAYGTFDGIIAAIQPRTHPELEQQLRDIRNRVERNVNAIVGGEAEGAAEGAAEGRARDYYQRAFYQLVVMFVLTLMPWWNPDPRYLT